MVDPESAFSLAGLLAVAGWLGLAVSLFARSIRPVVWPTAQLVIPAILSVGYILLMGQGRGAFDAGGFGSIGDVRALFANDSALAGGWVHYLAFDLFVGAWITRDSARQSMSPLLALPSLPLTFLFGPAGLLLHVILRFIFRRSPKEAVQ